MEKSNLASKLTGVEEHGNWRLPRTDHSGPKMHGARNCGMLAASQYCLGTLRGSESADESALLTTNDGNLSEPTVAPEWLITEPGTKTLSV